ncbi:hypothetical protein ALI144C_33895 [Actinosynnema sp. ALI-1.44]|uniref:hypothetical protein n=1 Tax=Actinosynnema sp. ALI-1.44 TaxID=1933779 RepID=UPI00097BB7F1|nr:hypothetical protein [Actinosynnema sp. ALI-1.44]ONI77087.1 hypothetical protein ALI144C_33895 [Actinosynnema sp. ALI-1.44]
MPDTYPMHRPARTVLEQLIWERRQTLEEFVEYAETFAREHKEHGTLSVRHLQRLIAGRRSNDRPLGPVRPTTARLLERIFNVDIDDLLAPPAILARREDSNPSLQERLQTSARVDYTVIDVLHKQLQELRYMDRKMGSMITHDEVRVKIKQVEVLLSFSISPATRARLGELLSELCMLAGWQALDLRNPVESWQYYEQAKSAARESSSIVYEIHARAQHAFVLIDANKPEVAAELLATSRRHAAISSPTVLQAWLAAAHGEALAACQRKQESVEAFDDAENLLPLDCSAFDGPYVALHPVHLQRWRGHGLARLGTPDAIATLFAALDQLDPSFARAEAALQTDLAIAICKLGDLREARSHAYRAAHLIQTIGSARQQWRIQTILDRYPTHKSTP